MVCENILRVFGDAVEPIVSRADEPRINMWSLISLSGPPRAWVESPWVALHCFTLIWKSTLLGLMALRISSLLSPQASLHSVTRFIDYALHPPCFISKAIRRTPVYLDGPTGRNLLRVDVFRQAYLRKLPSTSQISRFTQATTCGRLWALDT